MKSLIVAGIVLILLLLSLIINKKDKDRSDKYLIFYLCFALLKQIYFYTETFGIVNHSTWMLLGRGVYLLNAPLFFTYVYSLLSPKKLSYTLWIILLAPFVSYFIHFLYFHWFVFKESILAIESGLLLIDGEPSISWFIFVVLLVIIEPIYLIWFYLMLYRYKKGLIHEFSNPDKINFKWLYFLFHLWLIITGVLTPLSLITIGVSWISSETLDFFIQLTSLSFFFVLGYVGINQKNIFVHAELLNFSYKKPKKETYLKSGLSEVQASNYHKQLLQIMENQRPYLNSELRAGDLAKIMGISVNHLSQILNQVQKQNFFDFMNSYRIKEVIKKMNDPKYQHYTLLSMALDSGFNSKTSFNNTFKKIMQTTPSNYYGQLKENKG